MVICARCGLVGHTKGRCPGRPARVHRTARPRRCVCGAAVDLMPDGRVLGLDGEPHVNGRADARSEVSCLPRAA